MNEIILDWDFNVILVNLLSAIEIVNLLMGMKWKFDICYYLHNFIIYFKKLL